MFSLADQVGAVPPQNQNDDTEFREDPVDQAIIDIAPTVNLEHPLGVEEEEDFGRSPVDHGVDDPLGDLF